MTIINNFIIEKDVEVAAGAMNSGGLGGGSGFGGISGMSGGMNRSGGVMGNSGPAGLQYSIPGILHFLQHEWARFEMERGQWEVEKAELQVKYSALIRKAIGEFCDFLFMITFIQLIVC